MPRFVPSQVVEVIDQLYPDARTNRRATIGTGAGVTAIVALAKGIPPELLTLTGQDLSDYAVCLYFMESTQQSSLSHQRGYQVPEYRDFGTIFLLRSALAKCPDESPTPSTVELTFITDSALRESIRRDISAANQDMANAEWKGATVLAGSATEALLLWAIQRADPKTVDTAAQKLVVAGALLRKPRPNTERWDFIELIEVARQLDFITPDTATQARLGKDFRNLIHPGRAARLGQICDRATALSALAAVEHVVRDLTR